MLNDLRFAFRQLWKSPGFAFAVVLTLALGVGVNTAVFSMVNGFLLRPLPYRQPDRVGALVVHKEGNSPRNSQQYGSEEDNSFNAESWQLIKNNVNAADLAVHGAINGANMKASAAAGGAVRYVEASRVSTRYFDVVGLPLLLGRGFTEDEDRPGGSNAVVLSYSLWQAAFGGDKAILGKSIELKGAPFTVVGVLGSSALLPSRADVWTPLQIMSPHGECAEGPNCAIYARLKPGQSWNTLGAQLSRVRLPNFREIETKYHGHAWLYAQALQQDYAGDMREKVEVLMLAVGFILLIACANLAGLMLVRMSRRAREMSTRLALGASQAQILRQVWIESVVLALIGSGVGLALASLLLTGLSNVLPDAMVPVGGFGMDRRVIGFTFATALLTSVLFGVLPASQSLQIDIRSALASGGRTASTNSGRLRQWMIGAQVALSFVLLTGAGLLVRTLVHLTNLPPGFDAHNVLTAKASLDSARYREPRSFRALMRDSVTALRQIPGVQDAAAGLSVPYERGLNMGFKAMDGPNGGKQFLSSLAYVTPGYFSTLRVPLLAGRSFTGADTAESQPVAIVNTAFARRFFHDPRALGRHMNAGNINFTVCGVIADIAKKPGAQQDAPLSTEPVFYLPAAQAPMGIVNMAHLWFQPSWIVKTSGPISGLSAAMGRALLKADSSLPMSGVFTMEQVQAEQLQMQRIEVLLLMALALLALLLSAVGIYGTVANLVVQRTREIGIRLALGSTVKAAMLQVGRSGFYAAGLGLVIGVILSLFAVRALASEIYGVGRYDPITLMVVVLILGIVALSASLLPTLRISRIQLADSLMTE